MYFEIIYSNLIKQMPLLQLSSSPLLDFCEQCEKYHQLILVNGVLVQRSCENKIIESMAEEKILSQTNMTTRMTNTDSLNSLSSISIRNHLMPTSFNEAKERVYPPESLASIMKGPYVSLNTGQKPLSSRKSVEGRSKPKVLSDGRGLPDRSVSPIRGTKCLYHGHEVSPVVVRTKPAVNKSSSKIQSPIKQPLNISLSKAIQPKQPLSQSNSSFKPTPILLPPVSSSFPQPQPQPQLPPPTFTPTPIYISPQPPTCQPTQTPHFGSQSVVSQNKENSTTASIRSRRDLLKREYLVPEIQDQHKKSIMLGNSKGKSNGKEEYCCFGYMRCD